MLKIVIPEQELFNEETQEFVYTKSVVLTLEHSLLSISKWESKWKKPFLSKTPMNAEEMRDYIRCMTINTVSDENVYLCIPDIEVKRIQAYIDDKMTATWFTEKDNKKSKEIITSEIIYYWMIGNQIPFECEKWHLNRLLTLIRVCSEKNNTKKMPKKEAMNRQRALNAARRKALNSRG